MPLNIVLGKSKTGKSSYIYSNIQKDIQNKKNVILFVPSQLRNETENKYMEYLKKDGIIGVNITTISKYVNDVSISFGLFDNEKYISKLDKKMILTNAISKCGDSLKLFKKVGKKEGFLELIYEYVDLFRKSNFDINTIKAENVKNKLTYEKLKEISKIYEEYLLSLNEKFIDSVDEINLFLDNISNISYENTNIYIDAYNNFTENEFLVIQMLLKKVCNMTISITTDITKADDIYSKNTNDIFETSNLTYLKLLSIANSLGIRVENKIQYIKRIKQSEDIKYLSDNIFESSSIKKIESNNVHINLFSNTFDEIKNVAIKINEKVREGYRYNDFEIYTSDIQTYKSLITRIFFDTKIPVYINYEQNIKFSKLTTYIEKYLDILKNGINKDSILSILKLGLTDVTYSDIYELENYFIEFNLSKYSLFSKFKINNKKSSDYIYDLANLNKIREKIIDMYSNDLKEVKSADCFINCIFNHLVENNIFTNYENMLNYLQDAKNEFDLSNYDKQKQVWEKLCEIFNSISKIYNDDITFDKFIEIFKLSLKDTAIKALPPVIDSVEVADINLAKMSEKKIAFFIGVNDGKFPRCIQQDILFDDKELAELKDNNITFKQTTLSKQNMELYNIYQALNSIKEKLYICVPSSDFSGKNLRMSDIIGNIKKILNIKINGNVSNDNCDKNLSYVFSKNDMFKFMVESINKKVNLNEVKYIYEYIKKDNRYNELLTYNKKDDNLKDETLKLIYNNNITTSISKLELFEKCPFSYYMKYLLKIEPRKEFEISNLDIGSFMHEVLEEFSKYLFLNNILWHTLLLDEFWKKKLNEIIEEKLDKNLENKKQSIKYVILKQKLINTMQKVVIIIAKGFNQSEFVPYGYEIEFKDGGIFTPIKIKIDDDKFMNIIGKIDRVDTLNINEKTYVRIIDYKSSKKDLKLDDIKEGISLQLVTYLEAFIENIKKKNNEKQVLPAGMLYFNLSDKLVNLKDYINNEDKIKQETIKALRMKGIFLKDLDVIKKMDNKLNSDERLIDISESSLTKKSTNRALDYEEYNKLFDEIKVLLKSIGKEILNGVVKISPNKKSEPCKYCNYSSICRKNSCL